jgi:hypothetical protein
MRWVRPSKANARLLDDRRAIGDCLRSHCAPQGEMTSAGSEQVELAMPGDGSRKRPTAPPENRTMLQARSITT